MNYLVHLYLSDPDPEVRLGNLLGDWVKGRLVAADWPAGVLRGLRQHRAVDRHSVTSPAVRASKARIDDRFGILKPILVDIFYDHLLAANWDDYHHQPLEQFAADNYLLFERYRELLPESFRPVARRMAEHNWLVSYRDVETVSIILKRLSQRLPRPNLLHEGAAELTRAHRELKNDLDLFLKEDLTTSGTDRR
ncbi:acyl carrier protein phosphodiesterase [Geothermobacter ehrlichii]|uniref:Acyl carrier protein phosphodiesterase n=1 Tax=Geothermobacter ehrlichii TaxID=213224 RepID=A0A5D3WKS6_9BACT|nr:ACP phosphodiesterase [Geothermobacter ehrlichii]TYO98710.1 acyl carrier protein phosphodiesterase [Geothermobacter ehrlichii]